MADGIYSYLDTDPNLSPGMDLPFLDRHLNKPPTQIEKTMDQYIANLLAQRESDVTIIQKPVTLVDFGGGRGLSMIRLAAKWREQILAGKIIIAVTNLDYLPDPTPDSGGYTGVAKAFHRDNSSGYYEIPNMYSREELDFIQTYQGLVNFVQADAEEMLSIAVSSGLGKPVSLAGGIDILHERHVLSHIHTSDVAMVILEKCLSPQGTFFMQSIGMDEPIDYRPISTSEGVIDVGDDTYRQDMNRAFRVGIELLRLSGLIQEQSIGIGDEWNKKNKRGNIPGYSIWRKPQAPDYWPIRDSIK